MTSAGTTYECRLFYNVTLANGQLRHLDHQLQCDSLLQLRDGITASLDAMWTSYWATYTAMMVTASSFGSGQLLFNGFFPAFEKASSHRSIVHVLGLGLPTGGFPADGFSRVLTLRFSLTHPYHHDAETCFRSSDAIIAPGLT